MTTRDARASAAWRWIALSLLVHVTIAALSPPKVPEVPQPDTPLTLIEIAVETTEVAPQRSSAAASSGLAHVAVAHLSSPRATALPPPEVSGGDIAPEPTLAGPGPVPCASDDCVLEELDRCLTGDGDGCIGVGQFYERGRRDPFSAIKWYVKGCGLASKAACEAFDRVKDTMPLGWSRPAKAPI